MFLVISVHKVLHWALHNVWFQNKSELYNAVRTLGGDLRATVRFSWENIAKNRSISARPPCDHRMEIGRRSSGVYKRTIIGRWPADVRAVTVRPPHADRPIIARSSPDEVMLFSAHPQYESPLVVEELTKRTQTSQWILHVWINNHRIQSFNEEQWVAERGRRSPRRQQYVHRLVNKLPPRMLTMMKIVKNRVRKPWANETGVKFRTTKDLREMERKQRKSVLSGQATKMSRSRLSLRNIPYSTICPIWSTRTRGREIICYWNWPGPCSRQVACNLITSFINASFHCPFIPPGYYLCSTMCCSIWIIMISGANERNCLFDKSLKRIFCPRWLCCGIVWAECRQQAKL